MNVLVVVDGQRMMLQDSPYRFAPRSQKFVRFVFELSADWSDLTTFAQFTQNNQPYNVYLDSDKSAYLPSEIGSGVCTLMLYGTGENGKIGVTAPITLCIGEDYFEEDGQSTDITQSLYDQMIERVSQISENMDSAIQHVDVEYAQNQSNTTAPSSGWSTSAPAWRDGYYIWQRTVTTSGEGTSYSAPTCISGRDGINGRDGRDGEDGEAATVLRIDSSRGTVFKNSEVSTTLSVVIYRGPDRITDPIALNRVFGAGAHLQWSWQRMAEDRFGVISSSDSRLSNGGFQLTLTPADVDTKVTFMCELII